MPITFSPTIVLSRLLLAVCSVLVFSVTVAGQQQSTEEQVAAFKQSLAEGQAALRKYEWIETTTVSLKGEVKSVKQNRCYYGADGKVQKIPIEVAPQANSSGGTGGRGGRLKNRIVNKKKEELSEYMKSAVELVANYVPPNPALVKYSKETNNIKIEPLEQNRMIRLNLPNFFKVGDLLAATLDLQSQAVVDVNIATYLESEKDAVTLAVTFGRLTDGTNFVGRSVLEAKAKNIRVVVENSGYKPL